MEFPCNKCTKENKDCSNCIDLDNYMIEIKYFINDNKDDSNKKIDDESNMKY